MQFSANPKPKRFSSAPNHGLTVVVDAPRMRLSSGALTTLSLSNAFSFRKD